MQSFSNPVQFEKVLLDATDRTLGRNAVTSRNQRLGGNGTIWELDYVFEPEESDGRVYIFEFKYTSSPTLADSTVLTQFARFESLRSANAELSLGFLLVTNGIVRRNFEIPRSAFILDDIKEVDVWKKKITEWACREIPQWTRKSLPPG
ncbi:hypothetical protein [Burkholderia ubonensis]|uniref:hypothetical protein n=1 Tax=Burkholderia ubonensis TaxID=101571 RepID=UPI00111497B2|nr:hypothetical protein [Burkholderia ubonensis]